MVQVSSDIPDRIKATFPYNPQIVSKIKTVGTRRWNKEEKYWSSPKVLNELISALDGEKLDIDPSLGTLLLQETGENRDSRKLSEGDSSPDKLVLDRVRGMIRLKHYSHRTEDTYLHWIVKYLEFHNGRDPEMMGIPEIEAFLSHPAVDMKVAAGTQNVASGLAPCWVKQERWC